MSTLTAVSKEYGKINLRNKIENDSFSFPLSKNKSLEKKFTLLAQTLL